MRKYNVIETSRQETNDFYDPKLSRNGGGYSQPHIEFTSDLGNGWIMDNSCGEFGTRISAGFTTHVDNYGMKHEFRADWGTMYGDGSDSNFSHSYLKLLEEIYNVTGYRIPSCEEVKELIQK